MESPIVIVEPRERATSAPRVRGAKRVSGLRALRNALAHGGGALLVVPEEARAAFAEMRDAMSAAEVQSIGRLLLLGPTGDEPERRLLQAAVGVFVDAGIALVPEADLWAALGRHDRFVGGLVAGGKLLLYRGDLDPLIVPVAWFATRPDGLKPDPARFAIVDGGQTVRLGDYEAATEAILYDFDPAFRRRHKKNLIERDTSFGGALRRLRISRGLSRSDFGSVSEKEVARIERGEVKKPRGHTLAALARRLRVRPDEIASW